MKTFSKFEIATIKRTAANCERFKVKKDKLFAQIEKLHAEYDEALKAFEAWDKPIKELTGYSTEDLVVKVVNPETKVASYQLKYPDTVIPVEEAEQNNGADSVAPIADENQKVFDDTADEVPEGPTI